MKTLDEEIRDALMALDQSVPQDYFDEFPARVEARLEVRAMEPDKPSPDQTDDTGDSPRENTGLHDIKEMARTTRQKISRRISTQSDVEQSLLSTSSSGLKAVVLPTPGQDSPRYQGDGAGEPQREETRGGGVPLWAYGAVGLVAAAAVVFFVVRGGNKEKKTVGTATSEVTSTEPRVSVAAIDPEAAPAELPVASEPTDTPDQPEPAIGGSEGAVGAGAVAIDSDDGITAPSSKPADKAPRKAEPERPAKTSPAKADRAAATADPKKPAPPPPPPGDSKPAGDSIEAMLNEASGGAAGPDKDAAKTVVKKAPSKTDLSPGDIRTGMGSVLARVQACYSEHKQSGTVKVSVTVSPDGAVAKVAAVGQFASGALAKTGSCVAVAVENAKFPAWDGEAKTFKYSYLLSD